MMRQHNQVEWLNNGDLQLSNLVFWSEKSQKAKSRLNKHLTISTGEQALDSEDRRGKMSWAMRLKRVFNIDVSVCRNCQGAMRIIACIEDRQVINKILAHINRKQEPSVSVMTGAGIRAPPTDSRSLMTQ